MFTCSTAERKVRAQYALADYAVADVAAKTYIGGIINKHKQSTIICGGTVDLRCSTRPQISLADRGYTRQLDLEVQTKTQRRREYMNVNDKFIKIASCLPHLKNGSSP